MQKNLIVIIILLGAFLLLISVPSLLPFGKQTAELTDDIDVIEIDVSGISTTIIPLKETMWKRIQTEMVLFKLRRVVTV